MANRRNFLKLTSLTSMGLIFSSSLPLSALAKVAPKPLYGAADILFSEGLNAFYNRNYALAESKYSSAILLEPGNIKLYDGLQNVFGAQNKDLEIAELFKNALLINFNNILFYDRMAIALFRLHAGNAIAKLQYATTHNSLDLLVDANNLYSLALAIEPNSAFLLIRQTKLQNRISKFQGIPILSVNDDDISTLSETQILDRILNIDNKSRRTLSGSNEIKTREKNIIKEKKRLYSELYSRNRLADNTEKRIKYAELLQSIDPKDSMSFKVLKKLYKSTNNSEKLILLQNTKDVKNNFWARLGLAKIYLYLASKNGEINESYLDFAQNIYQEFSEQWVLTKNVQILSVYTGLSSCSSFFRDYRTAESHLISLLRKIDELENSHINYMCLQWSKIIEMQYNSNESIDLIKFCLGLNTNFEARSDSGKILLNYVTKKDSFGAIGDINLYYRLANLYNIIGDTVSANSVYTAIVSLQPNDLHAQQKLNGGQ